MNCRRLMGFLSLAEATPYHDHGGGKRRSGIGGDHNADIVPGERQCDQPLAVIQLWYGAEGSKYPDDNISKIVRRSVSFFQLPCGWIAR